jgi:Arc/MetJ family transcription regulator
MTKIDIDIDDDALAEAAELLARKPRRTRSTCRCGKPRSG